MTSCNWKPFKNGKKCFLIHLFVLKKFNFEVTFKIYDFTNWETNIHNTHIAQYLKKWRQSDNKIWSVNRIQHEKYFSWNLIHKIIAVTSYKTFLKNKKKSGTSAPASFSAWFLKKNVSQVLAKFHFLIVITSWNIGQFLYSKYLFLSLWRHKFWKWP